MTLTMHDIHHTLSTGVDYILFFRLLAEIQWTDSSSSSSSSSTDRVGAVGVASVVSELQEAFYDIPLHSRLVTALRSDPLSSNNDNNDNDNNNNNNSKDTSRVIEIGDELKEGPGSGSEPGEASSIVLLAAAWKSWLVNYHTRIVSDNRPRADRVREQHSANPKYVLRNWMAVLASEQVGEST